MTYRPRYPMGGNRGDGVYDALARVGPPDVTSPGDNPALDDALARWGESIFAADAEARRLEAAGVVDSSIVDALFGIVRGWRTQIGSVTGERPPTIDVDVAG